MSTIRGTYQMFKLQEKTIKGISSLLKRFPEDFQKYLYNKYFGILGRDQFKIIDWQKFIETNLNEDYYDDLINDIIDNVDEQSRNMTIEKIQNTLAENEYDFKMFDDKYRICIKGSFCLIYLTKENGYTYVNKRLIDYSQKGREFFDREKDVLTYIDRKNLCLSPKYISGDPDLIKMEKCEITLFDYIMSGFKIEAPQLIELLTKINDLHSAGILHRDLHPRNIMLKNKVLLVIDYNVAHYPFKSGQVTLEIHAGWNDYTDPIVYENGLNFATEKTDIYSIGKLINFIYSRDPNKYNHFLNAVSRKCTEPDINARYNSVYEIIKDIKLFLNI